jgi:hypothetical protein
MGSGGEGYPSAVGGDSDERPGAREFPASKGAATTVENRRRKASPVKGRLLRIVEIGRTSLENHSGNATFGRNAGYMGVREKNASPEEDRP